jgi:branched-chain amino acid transport system permease protein
MSTVRSDPVSAHASAPARPRADRARLPRERPWALVVLLALLATLPFLVTSFYLGVVVLGAIYAIAVLGLYFVMGLTGQLSLAQGAFFGLGAYASALVSTRLDWPFWPSVGAAVVAGLVVGVVLGYPVLRLTGHYLALATIGLAIIAVIVFQQWEPVTGGPNGVSGVKPPTIGSIVLSQNFYYFYLVWLFLVVLAAVAWVVKRSRVGRAFLAIREDQLAAAATGINTLNFKVLAFTLSTVYGSIAGALYAHGLTHYISPDNFVFDLSVSMLVMLLLGGQATVPGAILGAMVVTALPEGLRFLDRYYLVVYGIAVVLLVIFLPEGIWGWAQSVVERRRSGRRDRAPVPMGGEPGDPSPAERGADRDVEGTPA